MFTTAFSCIFTPSILKTNKAKLEDAMDSNAPDGKRPKSLMHGMNVFRMRTAPSL